MTCTNFSWEQGDKCYIVNNPGALEYASEKISGSRDCPEILKSEPSYSEYDYSYNK